MTTPADLKQPVQLAPSKLQSLLQHSLAQTAPSDLPALHTLALQIQHNLQYQHSWSALCLHTTSPLTGDPLPRPLLSGLPPQRLYVHPDEQIELLKQADQKRKATKNGDQGLEVQVEPEQEWVLPTRLSEKWTLRRLSEIFDAIPIVPPEHDASPAGKEVNPNPWRTNKRVVLASVDPDSTVVYYIFHDGVVKPRQN